MVSATGLHGAPIMLRGAAALGAVGGLSACAGAGGKVASARRLRAHRPHLTPMRVPPISLST
jgi:hypothetical protein